MATLSVQEILSNAHTLNNGVTILNVTPHILTFGYDDGSLETVQPCGYIANADAVQEPLLVVDGVAFVKTVFVPRPDEEALLDQLTVLLPERSVIVGSIIAAQAYPDCIVTGIQRAPNRTAPAAERVYSTYPNRFNRAG